MADQNVPKHGEEECIGARSRFPSAHSESTQGSDEDEDGDDDDVEEEPSGSDADQDAED